MEESFDGPLHPKRKQEEETNEATTDRKDLISGLEKISLR